MQTKFLKPLWGMEGSYREMFTRIQAAGFDGVETPMPDVAEESEFKELLQEFGLDFVPQIFTGGTDHAASFQEQVERAVSFKPLFVNSHSARDSMTFDEQIDFFTKALAVERSTGLMVGHETHRQRAMFTPWTTARLLEALPELKLTADLSHWTCVCESHLEDNQADIALAVSRTLHIHARVGYAEGPQVPDPSAPEYATEVALFEGWWKQMIQARAAQGQQFAYVAPEFGPPGYLHTLPHTNVPVADLWEVNDWIYRRFRENVKQWV
ncbi:sugar phosphate isomerase/epimerase [Paenibacillus sp. OV219]|uniref:sugar phosphate isomerase/epimerase family protein n=1 Tax=Paenibacillus sp. OV219 TaxID=1884377 RepID=UPI0008C43C3B|nr:TIM barrel protein [Paenibacillus sp. OV219]SEM86966.1 Xylose isomerase-like TIM barrel [Paenibacillus sp. OV219]